VIRFDREVCVVETIEFKLNGKTMKVSADADRILLWYLRVDAGQTGTKYGCGEGFCGACTVLLNSQPTRSCLLRLRDVAGKDVVTIEGLAQDGKLNPVQQAFVDHDALQCGFCTPGMILQAHALLQKTHKPTTDEIKQSLEGHLCRCGSYQRIVAAVKAVAGEVKHG
jgi:aerobic-type carbon monoxide dehydrogenase small subunit (CoxS/CutS family)